MPGPPVSTTMLPYYLYLTENSIGRGGRAADHNEDENRTRGGLGSPLGRKNASQDRDRGKQPRCEDDDSNAY
jgi:hypothetical protein